MELLAFYLKLYPLAICINMIAVGHWTKVSEAMPKETKYESDNLQGHYEWTESDRVLVITDHEESFVDSTKNGKFNHDGLKDCDGFPHWIVAWMPIPPFNNIEESEISDDLEEAANTYKNSYSDPNGALARAAKRAYITGARWQKEQLIKNAISCKVFWYDGPKLDYTQEQQDNVLEKIGADVDDNVQVIILKEN